MLQLTYRDLENIIREYYDRFTVLHHGIPYGNGENPNDYLEDDGRQYRTVDFKDNETGKEYYLQYVWHPEWDYDFPACLLISPKGVEFVEVSVINPPKPKVEEEVVLTSEQIADTDIWKKYLDMPEKQQFTTLKAAGLTKADIDDICIFLMSPFNIYRLRSRIIPICIEKGLEEKSFWNYIQKQSRKFRKKHSKS